MAQKKDKPKHRVSLKEFTDIIKTKRILATYSISLLGEGGFTNFTRGMRNIYFVQVMGLSNVQYATATVIGNFVNGIVNPVIGFLMDKRIFKRKYSPWKVIGVAGSVCSYLILYFIPWTPLVNNKSVSWFAAMLMVVLVGGFFAITNLNNNCVFSGLTMDGRERIIARILTNYVGSFGRVFGTMIFPVVLTYFSTRMGDARSYFPTVAVLGAIAFVFALINAREIRKYIPADIEGIKICEETGKHIAEDSIPAKEMIKNLFKNYPLLILVINSVIAMTFRTFASALPNIYYKYVLGDLRWLSVYAGIAAMMQPVIKTVIPVLAVLIGDPKRLVVVSRMTGALANFGITALGRNPWVFIGLRIFILSMNELSTIANPILKTGAVDFGEWKTGVRHPGMIMALSGVGANAGQAIGIIIRTAFLEWTGFLPGFSPDEQFKTRILKGFMIGGIFTAIQGTLIALFYPINKKKLEELKILLEEKKEQTETK